jgi:hypothetical protein
VDTVEDLVAMFDRLIERSDTDAADVKSCLVQILERASDFFRPEPGTNLEHSALLIAKFALMEGAINETRAAGLLMEMSSLADDVLDGPPRGLTTATRDGLESIWDAYDWSAERVGTQLN